MKRKIKRYNGATGSNVDGAVGEAVGDSNEGMKETRDAYDASQAAEANKAKEAADEMRERAKAEGARDADKIIESGNQGFGGAGSSRTVKAMPKATLKAAKAAPKLIDPSNIRSGRRSDEDAVKKTPIDETKLSLSERMKMSRDRAKSGSGPTDTRSVSQRLRSAFGMKSGGATKMASGGMTSSASKRADGIAVKGKTRGKMC